MNEEIKVTVDWTKTTEREQIEFLLSQFMHLQQIVLNMLESK